MNRFVISTAIAAAIAVLPSAASAAPFINYTLNVGGSFTTQPRVELAGPFSNTWTFTTTIERNATLSFFSQIANPQLSFADNVNFISNGVRLNTTIVPIILSGVTEWRVLTDFRIPAGLQTILVRGNAGPLGQYTTTLALGAVPEASTWAMMICGFGLVGAAMRRRRVKTSVSFA